MKWQKLGISPAILSTTTYSDNRIIYERAIINQRFLFLLLTDAIVASKSDIIIDNKVVLIRINPFVANKKEDILALYKWKYFSVCLNDFIVFSEDPAKHIKHIEFALTALKKR